MTSLITGDWHFSSSPRDHYRHEWQKELRKTIKKNKVETLVVLGDLTEEKDRHSAWLVNTVVDHFVKLAKLCDVVIVEGNHDYVSEANPFFAFLSRIDGLHWVSVPTEAESLSLSLSRSLSQSLFLPHSSDPATEWADLDFEQYHLIFAHQMFEGADVGHGHIMKGTSLSMFAKNNTIISGDVHIPQTIGSLEYVGAPYTVDFGDDYQGRVLLLDNDGTFESIDTKGPQKVLIEVSLEDGIVELSDAAEALGIIPGDILKVRIKMFRNQFAEWPRILQIVREWGKENDYNVHTVQPVLIDELTANTEKRSAANRKSDKQLLEEYVTRMRVDERTAKAGEELLK